MGNSNTQIFTHVVYSHIGNVGFKIVTCNDVTKNLLIEYKAKIEDLSKFKIPDYFFNELQLNSLICIRYSPEYKYFNCIETSILIMYISLCICKSEKISTITNNYQCIINFLNNNDKLEILNPLAEEIKNECYILAQEFIKKGGKITQHTIQTNNLYNYL